MTDAEVRLGSTAAGSSGEVAVIDSDAVSALRLRAVLQARGLGVSTWAAPAEAIPVLTQRPPDAIVLALPPGLADAREAVGSLRVHINGVPLVGVVAAAPDSAIAQQVGCVSWVVRPVQPDQLAGIVARAIATGASRRQLGPDLPPALAGTSRAAQSVVDLIARVAPLRISTLLSGEPGTGREAAARHIHALSRRRHKRFVSAHCGAHDWNARQLFEPALAGTNGTTSESRSLFEDAHQGTLFLHEVSALPMQYQLRTLQVVHERVLRRGEASAEADADVRLVASTSVNLAEAVEMGRFYAGLYFRLNVLPLVIAPLRERREDIPVIADAVRSRFGVENGVEPPRIPWGIQERLMAYDWPGNTRQLEHYLERAFVVFAGRDVIEFEPPSEPPRESPAPWRPPSEEWTLERVEREYIDWVLKRTRGHQGEAARILGISRRTLYRRLRDSSPRWGATGSR